MATQTTIEIQNDDKRHKITTAMQNDYKECKTFSFCLVIILCLFVRFPCGHFGIRIVSRFFLRRLAGPFTSVPKDLFHNLLILFP